MEHKEIWLRVLGIYLDMFNTISQKHKAAVEVIARPLDLDSKSDRLLIPFDPYNKGDNSKFERILRSSSPLLFGTLGTEEQIGSSTYCDTVRAHEGVMRKSLLVNGFRSALSIF